MSFVAMDHALQPAGDKINYKICNTCRQAMDTHSPYKNCLLCRARDKARRQKYLLKKKAMQQMMVQSSTDHLNRKYDATGASSTKERQENASTSSHYDGSRKVSAGVKRKAEKSINELEGEERVVALKMAKKSLTEIIQRQGIKEPLPIANLKSVKNGQEYLNASSLYDALKSKALSSYPASKNETQFLQFHGSHSIIAVPSIDNIKRANLVATDLRKIARLSYEPNATSSLRSSESVSLSYPCSCVGHIQAVPSVPALPCSKINGAGSLVKWARAKVASTSNQALPRSCGGKVIVTVLDDNSHTLEILGQQIIVRVEHPNV